ncbi:hypothetical protein PR048_013104 [Dryococelus australis]|uniref:Integrase catalytic domain-containing protein n=1 Tax=Dryococelus australis TaxID=614101 RepID=A0ABQ9HR66_9NEOP|nr:hypothetical protein PR048_013104 [Dryococelus australis]
MMHFRGANYFLVVDSYTKYPELVQLKDLNSSHTFAQLKATFAIPGIPEILYNDNGPQQFATLWNFQNKSSSLTYVQSNGFIE